MCVRFMLVNLIVPLVWINYIHVNGLQRIDVSISNAFFRISYFMRPEVMRINGFTNTHTHTCAQINVRLRTSLTAQPAARLYVYCILFIVYSMCICISNGIISGVVVVAAAAASS